ncbi:MAG: DUF5060 domain-containing protein, partial [Bacteroidota bacterium]|nr:DUF5060 domain-containing protein [Bacteroidota bacterium]
MKKTFVPLLAFLLTGLFCSAKPVFQKVSASDQNVRIFEKYELTLDMTARYTNPFDFDQVNLKGTFQSPSGKMFTVDGFYYADFTHSCNPSTFDEGIKDEGTHHWKIRFTPFEAGPWKVIISCVDADGTTTYPEELSFNCIPVAHAKGFIRKANNMYLKYDNGDFYFPVNMNAGWCDAT